ncbi:MAG: hypothetical protein JSS81_05605 [Acidobacteria bacterium]|nr:hypothetical protein [Acidobacteriota bacterium]
MLVSSGPGSLSFYSAADKQFDFVATTLDQALLGEYTEYYQHVSPFRKKIDRMAAGERFSRAAHLADGEFTQTEIYRNYFRRQDVFNFEYLIFYKEDDVAGGISFSRSRRQKNFDRAETRALDFILPHLRRAFQIHLKLTEVRRDKKILLECFEKIAQGVVVVNRAGRPVFMNERARRLLDDGDGLAIDRRGALSANSPADAKKLKACLQGLFDANGQQRFGRCGVLQMARASGRRPLTIFVSPFVERSLNPLNSGTLAVLYISDPAAEPAAVEPVLTEIYGLTPAEAKLAAILARGATLSEAGTQLGIKQNTIRTHLKRIFSKTETNRQSELVKLILNSSVDLGR